MPPNHFHEHARTKQFLIQTCTYRTIFDSNENQNSIKQVYFLVRSYNKYNADRFHKEVFDSNGNQNSIKQVHWLVRSYNKYNADRFDKEKVIKKR